MRLSKYICWILLCSLFVMSSPGELSAKSYSPQHTSVRNTHKTPYVSQKNYRKFWYKSTFPTNQASINYHTNKHGKGRSPLKYTRDAVNFYENNKHLRQP